MFNHNLCANIRFLLCSTKLKDVELEEYLYKIGQRIKTIRTQKKISQRDLAYLIDSEKSNISVMENGKNNFKLSTLYKIAKALDVSISELIDIENINE